MQKKKKRNVKRRENKDERGSWLDKGKRAYSPNGDFASGKKKS